MFSLDEEMDALEESQARLERSIEALRAHLSNSRVRLLPGPCEEDKLFGIKEEEVPSYRQQ